MMIPEQKREMEALLMGWLDEFDKADAMPLILIGPCTDNRQIAICAVPTINGRRAIRYLKWAIDLLEQNPDATWDDVRIK